MRYLYSGPRRLQCPAKAGFWISAYSINPRGFTATPPKRAAALGLKPIYTRPNVSPAFFTQAQKKWTQMPGGKGDCVHYPFSCRPVKLARAVPPRVVRGLPRDYMIPVTKGKVNTFFKTFLNNKYFYLSVKIWQFIYLYIILYNALKSRFCGLFSLLAPIIQALFDTIAHNTLILAF